HALNRFFPYSTPARTPRSATGALFFVLLVLLGFANGAHARAPMTCADVERLALEDHPVLAEKALEVDKAREKLRDVDMGVILPKFEVETGIGPAPGIRFNDRNAWLSLSGDTLYDTQRRFDFGEWGPFFGIKGSVVQPLNIARYRAGRRAATLQVRVSEAQFQKERLDVSEEAQTICNQRLFALTMQRELASSKNDLDKAQRKLVESLDAGDENVEQTDVLRLKSGRYALDHGLHEADLGVRRSELALRFAVAARDSEDVPLADTVLSPRTDVIPPLDTLKMAALRFHPDLQRLRNGLAARRELLKVAQGEIGPDIFLFGNIEYGKAWSSDRQSSGGDPFARDPLNELTGVAGLGMRLRLNFWERYQSYRKERLDLRQLERTEVYAARGILMKVQDAWMRVEKARADMEDAQLALRAADAWLKGAAMRYDLDRSEARNMTSPFRQAISSRNDYYSAVLEYNIAVASLFKSVGWTLSDYLGSLKAGNPPEEPKP
ncbi:MAG TPA: TolC family protein, partial [Fibrobacteria bacterium]|nr:TolC family protein [Fibrobacteria bacterium]